MVYNLLILLNFFNFFGSWETWLTRVIVALTFTVLILSRRWKSPYSTPLVNISITIFILLTLSSISSQDPLLSLKKLVRLMTGFSLFALFFMVGWHKISQVPKLFLVLNLVSCCISLSMLIGGDGVTRMMSRITSTELINYFQYELGRGRLPLISVLHMTWFIPLLILLDRKHNKYLRGLSLFVSVFSALVIMLSNYRTYLLSVVVTLALIVVYWISMYAVSQSFKLKLLLITISTTILYLLISAGITKTNVFERMLLRDVSDREAIQLRWANIDLAIEEFKSRPILGLGLATTEILAPTVSIRTIPKYQFDPLMKESLSYKLESHNIFFEYLPEIGIVGVSVLSYLTFLMLKSDVRNSKDIISFFFKLASWNFLLVVFFDSYMPVYLYMFFIIRGIIANRERQLTEKYANN